MNMVMSGLKKKRRCLLIWEQMSDFIRPMPRIQEQAFSPLSRRSIKTAELNPSITVCPFAVSDKRQELEFFVVAANIGATRDINLFGDSWGEEKGIKEIVQATSLDEYMASNSINKLDFIKADIEGAERDMLKGAKDTLQKFSPKLSICTYHLSDDREVLPRLILEAQPKYKITHVGNKLFAHV